MPHEAPRIHIGLSWLLGHELTKKTREPRWMIEPNETRHHFVGRGSTDEALGDNSASVIR